MPANDVSPPPSVVWPWLEERSDSDVIPWTRKDQRAALVDREMSLSLGDPPLTVKGCESHVLGSVSVFPTSIGEFGGRLTNCDGLALSVLASRGWQVGIMKWREPLVLPSFEFDQALLASSSSPASCVAET